MVSNREIALFIASSYTKKSAHCENTCWKKFLNSDEVNASSSGYYGVAYINNNTREIVIANSGTNFNVLNFKWIKNLDFWVPLDFIQDVFSCIQVYFGYIPNQFKYGAEKFTDSILCNLGDSAKTYKFITAGHSLGAVIANLENAKIAAAFNSSAHVSSLNFDSPGSAPIVEEYISKFSNLNSEQLAITTFNTPKHILNNIHQELGRVYEYQIPHSQGIFYKIFGAIETHYFRNIIKYIHNNEDYFSQDNQLCFNDIPLFSQEDTIFYV